LRGRERGGTKKRATRKRKKKTSKGKGKRGGEIKKIEALSDKERRHDQGVGGGEAMKPTHRRGKKIKTENSKPKRQKKNKHGKGKEREG